MRRASSWVGMSVVAALAIAAQGCAASNGDTQSRDVGTDATGSGDAAAADGGLPDGALDSATPGMMDATSPPDAGVVDGGVDAGDAGAGEDAARGTGQICDSCRSDGDCALAHQCVSLTTGGQACVPECVPDLPSCVRDFECLVDLTSGADGPVCLPVGGPCCVDLDGDDYGQGIGCDGRDCDDSDALINPGMPDVCNGMDDNCNDIADEGSPERCDNDEDDDCDGVTDCADGECAGTPCGGSVESARVVSVPVQRETSRIAAMVVTTIATARWIVPTRAAMGPSATTSVARASVGSAVVREAAPKAPVRTASTTTVTA